MKLFIKQNISAISWTLGSIVTILAVYVWASGVQYQFSSLTIYSIFPLLGLLAFSLMWTHYVIHSLNVYAEVTPTEQSQYAKITGYAVLMAIMLHPGLLIYKLYADGFGLPPKSYLEYVGPTMGGFVILGTIALIAFILYELRHKLNKYKWWPVVLAFNAVAMLLILVHGLALGQNLQNGFLRAVWYFYGFILVVCYGYLIRKKKLY